MKPDWHELLYRALDGESLAGEEVGALRAALTDPANRESAAELLRFAEVLSGHLRARDHAVSDVTRSRDRLLAKTVLRQKSREAEADGRFRKRPRWVRTATWFAVAAACVVLFFAGWYFLSPPDYPRARLAGNAEIFRDGQPVVASAGEPRRGDVIRTRGQSARLSLGGYCELLIDPHTELSWQGAPRQEVVELRGGKISSRITPGAGDFRCRTPLGTLEVLGTEFVTEVKFPQDTKGEAAVKNAAIVTVFIISGTVGFDMVGTTGTLTAGETKVFEKLASGADRVANPRAAVKKAAESNEAAEQLLALGPSVIPALHDYIRQYPDTVNVSRESRWEWRAARRCERILRLLEEQRLRENEGTESDAAEPFIRATGLAPAKGQTAFEEALIPNRALMEVAAEAAGMDCDTAGEPERAAFRERFDAAFTPVAERWKKGVRLDAFANPAKPAYPMSDVVIGDLLALLFARTQVPDAWTLDWYVDASRLLANWRDFEKTNPRLSRLELTLQEKDTALTAALEVLIHKAAEKSETITGRTAAAWVALANRMQPMALDLAADIVAKDLPAFRQRERTAPDPASGKTIGRLEESGPRLKVTTEANIQPGEFLVASRDGQFVSWLKVTKDGEHVASRTAHRRLKPQAGDEVLLPPDEALLPGEKDAALQTWFATVHIFFSYGKTEKHARQLKEFLEVDGKISVYSGMYRIRDFAMIGLLQLTGEDQEKYETKTAPGGCPWSWPGGLKLLEFGEGEQWKAAQEMMDAWFDSHAAESEPGQELPNAGKLSVEKTSNLKIGIPKAQFQLTTRTKAAQSDKHFHLIDPQVLGDEDTAAKNGAHRVIPGPTTVFVINPRGQLHGMGLNSRGSLGLSAEITASRDPRPIFDKPVRQCGTSRAIRTP